MRFNKQIHWADGLFLQPHHFQQLQRSLLEQIRNERCFFLPYRYGFIELSIDTQALLSRRVVVNSFSAIMPDNQELSMPGNCSLSPLTIEKPGMESLGSFLVYLVLPEFIPNAANLDVGNNSKDRLYSLFEQSVADENTGDNEIALISRIKRPYLATDIGKLTSCTALPLARLKWISYHGQEPVLGLDLSYMPPFILLSADCPIGNMVGELLFQLKSCRDHVHQHLLRLDVKSNAFYGLSLLRELEILSEYEILLSNQIVAYRTSPYELYLSLSRLLVKLSALDYSKPQVVIPDYNHDDALLVFEKILSKLRLMLAPQGAMSFSRVEFLSSPDRANVFYADFSQSNAAYDSEFYLALTTSEQAEMVKSCLINGDNFRLVDDGALDLRIRGFKLSFLTFAPRQFPNVNKALWFKIHVADNQSMFENILANGRLCLDKAAALFPDFKASLFITVKADN